MAQSLIDLSEEEIMIRDSVKEFAEEEISDLAIQMDINNHIEPALIDSFFELGIMGIEIPEEYDGMGGTFFQSILVIEELAKA